MGNLADIDPQAVQGRVSSFTHARRPKQLKAAAKESALMIPTAEQFQPSCGSVPCPICLFLGAADQISEPEQARDLHGAPDRCDLHLVQTVSGLITRRTALG
jgi:hypothetical protein